MPETSELPFAVFGATGQQGGAVVDALLDRGASVRAILRDPDSDSGKALSARGVSVVSADQDDAVAMTAALLDVSGVFLMTTYDDTSGGTEGARSAGAERWPRPSLAPVCRTSSIHRSAGPSATAATSRAKRLVEKALADVVPASFIRPTFFLENLTRALSPNEDADFVLRLPMRGDVSLQMVAVRDIGIVSAAVLLDPAVLPGGSIEIAGDALTADAIADGIGEYLGKPGRFEELPLSALGSDTDRQAMFRWFVETPAYQADFDATKRIDPDVLDLTSWLRRNR